MCISGGGMFQVKGTAGTEAAKWSKDTEIKRSHCFPRVYMLVAKKLNKQSNYK